MRHIVFALVCAMIATAVPSSAQDQKKHPSPTELSRAHEIHQQLFNGRGRQDLLERANREGDVEVIRDAPMAFFDKEGRLPSVETTIRNSTCSADAVIVVSILNATSHLSKDRTWVFTDYLTKVESVLKNNPLHPIQDGDELVVARGGGSLELSSGKRITTRDLGAPPLLLSDHYLLFVTYVPESGQYRSSGVNDAFGVANQHVRPLNSGRHPDAPLPDLPSVSTTVNGAGCRVGR